MLERAARAIQIAWGTILDIIPKAQLEEGFYCRWAQVILARNILILYTSSGIVSKDVQNSISKGGREFDICARRWFPREQRAII